jgi:MoaA/NifB/PqqE/SkfB family radical SAM enzyme
VLFFFGGEPFLYKPVIRMMGDIDLDPGCRLFVITNGTLLTPAVRQQLEARNIGMFAVSLDAANGETFDQLRVRGRNASWDLVMANLAWVANLRKRKNFFFEISMTVNSQNCREIEAFVDLGLEHGAEPLLLLVSNPFQTPEFQAEYLRFSEAQFDDMDAQIGRSLAKVRACGFHDAEAALVRLRRMLADHRRSENSVLYYRAKTIARRAFRTLPESVQFGIRRMLA